MALSQAELVKRADIALSDLSTNGGLLNPEQANMFIDMVQETPTILNQSRVVTMNAPSMKINRLGFGSRIMAAAPQGASPYADDDGTNDRYLLAADRSSPTTSNILLETVETIAEVHLPYEVLEDNIEGQSFEEHVMRLIAARAAEDFEELALEGDTGHATDTYLQLLDGLLATATSNVVDNLSAGISPDVFEAGLLAMPQKYLRNRSALRNFIPVAQEIKYRANVAKRATGYGDSALQEGGGLVAYGVPVEGAPLMPAATGLLTYPQNILFGIQRQIQIETEKDIRARSIIIVLTARVDVKWDDQEAVVKYINV
jgi:hypothetical protein